MSKEIVIGKTVTKTVTPTLTSGAAYVTGDYVGTDDDATTITGAARVNGGSGWICGATMINTVAESINGELWIFDTEPTVAVHDSAAWSIADAEAAKCIGVISFDTWKLSAVNAVGYASEKPFIPFVCASDSKNLYCCYVTRGTLTGAPTFRLHILQD
jgi:hypothetical protein